MASASLSPLRFVWRVIKNSDSKINEVSLESAYLNVTSNESLKEQQQRMANYPPVKKELCL